MKRTFLIFVTFLGMTLFATAQQTAKKITPFSLEALEKVQATPQQKQQFKDLKKEYDEQLQSIKKNKELTKEEKTAAYKKLNQHRNRVYWKKILTKEQANRMREQQKAAKDARE